MPQTRECDYCGSDIPPGTGTMFVRTDGTTIHYCSSKCENNAELGREPRDVEWTEAGGARDGAPAADAEQEPAAEEGVEEQAGATDTTGQSAADESGVESEAEAEQSGVEEDVEEFEETETAGEPDDETEESEGEVEDAEDVEAPEEAEEAEQ